MIQNTGGCANALEKKIGHQSIVDEGCAEGHCFGDTLVSGSLHHGDKTATSPGHDLGFSAGSPEPAPCRE